MRYYFLEFFFTATLLSRSFVNSLRSIGKGFNFIFHTLFLFINELILKEKGKELVKEFLKKSNIISTLKIIMFDKNKYYMVYS